MRKEMILNKEDIKDVEKNAMMSAILSPILYVVDMLTRYFSYVLEEKYTRRKTLLLLHAQIAFTFAAFPADFSIVLRMLFVSWFLISVKLFKKYR